MRVLPRALERIVLKVSQLKYSDIWYQRTIRGVARLTEREKAARGIERTVRLLGNFPGLWQRTIEQTPHGSCQWQRTLFVAAGRADRYVILNAMHGSEKYTHRIEPPAPRPEHVWALHMEPEEYISRLGYDAGEEHSMVSRFYTSSRALLARGGIYRPSPPYVHFNLGRSWDYLSTAAVPEKTIALGIITSDLTDLAGHVERVKFLERLDASGIDYVLWGRGDGLRRYRNYRGFVLSKWQAHAACRHSIVIENSVAPLYWSEKVADALLAYSLPLYHGSPELARYLPEDSFIPIDIRDADVIDRLREILARNEYQRRLAAVAAARRVLLETENLYAFLDRELDSP
jgi:hypothetical protein